MLAAQFTARFFQCRLHPLPVCGHGKIRQRFILKLGFGHAVFVVMNVRFFALRRILFLRITRLDLHRRRIAQQCFGGNGAANAVRKNPSFDVFSSSPPAQNNSCRAALRPPGNNSARASPTSPARP